MYALLPKMSMEVVILSLLIVLTYVMSRPGGVRKAGIFLAVFVFPVASVLAQKITVDPPWSDEALIQRGKPSPISGTAAAGQHVSVTFQKGSVEVVADKSGHWEAQIPAVAEAGGPFVLTIRCADETLNFKNILVGDVWLCSGQSNMEFPLIGSSNGKEEVEQADVSKVRLLHIGRNAALEPQDKVQESWQACTPENAAKFSAVAYFFGKELAEKTDIPIGLIEAAWGGKPGHVFMSRQAVASNPVTAPIIKAWDDGAKQMNEESPKKNQAKPEEEGTATASPYAPGALWNGMIHPITKFPIRGVIWYQGEANAAYAAQYRELLPALIGDWRKEWKQGAFPFYIVQLINFRPPSDVPGDSKIAELREAQYLASRMPGNGLAVTIDTGDQNRIHSRNKKTVGERLALLALHRSYGMDVGDSGPMYQGMEIKGNEVIVHFDNAEGLYIKDSGQDVVGFSVAGADKIFHWATGRIEGETVKLSCPEVAVPVAVRYAWADNPSVNLYNKENLPAAPFRTDDWPGITAGKSWRPSKKILEKSEEGE